MVVLTFIKSGGIKNEFVGIHKRNSRCLALTK